MPLPAHTAIRKNNNPSNMKINISMTLQVRLLEARSMRVSASCAAIASAGPTGSPARRSNRAKCMTLAAMRGLGWERGSWVADIRAIRRTEDAPVQEVTALRTGGERSNTFDRGRWPVLVVAGLRPISVKIATGTGCNPPFVLLPCLARPPTNCVAGQGKVPP